MNLIFEQWIPIRRADGSREKIFPWEMTKDIDDEHRRIVAIASPRPDFDGALIQFLIGLLQTTCTPPDKMTWRKWRKAPPSADELKARFETVAFAFELEGEKAFMQDFSPSELPNKSEIAALLIETPGDHTELLNKDHFIKRGLINSLCPHCAALSLFSLQINAPLGGQGNRTGLRGGGPLTTLVLGNTLWETSWLNILIKANYQDDESEHDNLENRFPWLSKTRTSEAKPPAGITTPIDVHPDQQFWATPRRIRLISVSDHESKFCSVCGSSTELMFNEFHNKNYGANYQGFEHSLSPHYIKDGSTLTTHPQSGGIGYRHWLGLIVNTTEGNTLHKPAKVVEQFRSLVREDARLWAFGYDMDNMKARCWYDATMPILLVPEGFEDIFKGMAERLVRAADWVSSVLRGYIKDAMFGESDTRGDLSFVQQHFWSATEGPFYNHVRRLRDELSEPENEQSLLVSWRNALRESSLSIFDHYAQNGDFDADEPRQIAVARNNLSKMLNGKKLHDLLGLPKP